MRTVSALLAVGVLTVVAATPAAAKGDHPRRGEAVIALPNGFFPEDIARGRGDTFYTGSLVDGAVYQGNFRTGKGRVLVPGTAGTLVAGVHVDPLNRLWTVGGPSGTINVYRADTGAAIASYQVPRTGGFLSDVVVTPTAAVVTDSFSPYLHVVPLDRYALPEPRKVRSTPLQGAISYAEGFNANGIVAVGDRFVVGQTNTGKLFEVSRWGWTREIRVSGGDLTGIDGMVRRGDTLVGALNLPQRIAEVRLDIRKGCGCVAAAEVTARAAFPTLDVPAAAEVYGPDVYAVNARFGTPATPETAYQVVRVPRLTRR